MQNHSRIVERVLTRLKFKQLRLLIAVARHRSILHAARELNVSQPAATKMIKDLELDFEVRLFERTNRGVVPTIYGETLIRHGKLIFAQVNNAAQELDDLTEGTSGRIVVGTLLAASSKLLPMAIERTVRDRPQVVIKVVEGTNEVLMPALRVGELDMVVGRLPVHRHREEIEHERLIDDDVALMARAGHPLTGKPTPTMSDLLAYGWILPPIETTLRRQIDQLFSRQGGASPRSSVESASYLTNRELLKNTDLLAVMPRQVAHSSMNRGALAEINWTSTIWQGAVGVSYARGTTLSPAAQDFLDALRAVAPDV
ncbi:LysR substrate-binding domain-containing protein [Sulfitobacter sp. S190]|uniref:LysR substrate-binding domain-containing protein n=1 Tax=Sulfitobacter sp. S190 TaxID=2867022 RepID=UPI002882DCC5|nr:LysR substrate-binding domain-containing protein [Sulfitobacter sp. S190]